MDLAAFSPRKYQLLNQASPRGSARKRSLFPSNSPQSNDLGLIGELYSDDSEVYSPPLLSPSLSITPGRDGGSPRKNKTVKAVNNLKFSDFLACSDKTSPRKSPRKKSLNKENNMNNMQSIRKSPRNSFRQFLGKESFDDHFITVLSDKDNSKTEKAVDQYEIKRSDNLTTPQKKTSVFNSQIRRSPRSASKQEGIIKPISFYGKLAPLLATNQTNRIQGMKCVFRPPQQSRAKAKLLFDDKKPTKKRERSRSMDAFREAKKRKSVFTGVHHAIPKPVHHSPHEVQARQLSVREKAKKVTDLSRTPYGVKKNKQEGWEYTMRFTKPMRYDESKYLGTKRKFFKTSVKDSPTSSPRILDEGSPPFVPQKRIKLLDTSKSYIGDASPEKLKINVSDISDLIDDDDKLQDKPEVDDILLRLEEDDEEENRREAERLMLMNILEDSPMKTAAIDSLSDCTASLDLNDSFSGSSRFVLDDRKETPTSSNRMFAIFSNSKRQSVTGSSGSSGRKKWRGVGEDQLQIDAGQKRYGAYQCAECGMLYQAGEAEDEMQHESFHNSLTVLRHTGWKNENVVGCFGLDYIIMVTGDCNKSWQRKALEIMGFVDKSLGITSDISNVMHNNKVFLYIADKRIVGCMVATPVSRAYKMMSSESDVDICSEESYPIRCGVSRMWTLFSHRRQGVASKLLDTVRRNFMYGYILSREDFAFSIPTPDGKRFATKYMESPNFLVYTGY